MRHYSAICWDLLLEAYGAYSPHCWCYVSALRNRGEAMREVHLSSQLLQACTITCSLAHAAQNPALLYLLRPVFSVFLELPECHSTVSRCPGCVRHHPAQITLSAPDDFEMIEMSSFLAPKNSRLIGKKFA